MDTEPQPAPAPIPPAVAESSPSSPPVEGDSIEAEIIAIWFIQFVFFAIATLSLCGLESYEPELGRDCKDCFSCGTCMDIAMVWGAWLIFLLIIERVCHKSWAVRCNIDFFIILHGTIIVRQFIWYYLTNGQVGKEYW